MTVFCVLLALGGTFSKLATGESDNRSKDDGPLGARESTRVLTVSIFPSQRATVEDLCLTGVLDTVGQRSAMFHQVNACAVQKGRCHPGYGEAGQAAASP